MNDSILTLCLFPFPSGALWLICETAVSSRDDIEEIGADACKSNTTIENHPADAADHALQRARQIAVDKSLPLYMIVVNNADDSPDTLELIEQH